MTSSALATPSPGDGGPSTLRRDIEGLRAVAVVAVLAYHAGVSWLPGGFVGVDVFFVISGYLITLLMLREVARTGRLRLRDFWARRARRLLPAGTFVLLFSAFVTVMWLPVTSRREFGGDIAAAALYAVNWRLGYREVDYLAEDVGLSPVQHYWSLAVEEQFYVLWPLLVAGVAALAGRRHRAALFAVVLALTATSFAWAVHYSVDQPGLAFFVSTTRLWELGVGALLAVAAPAVRRVPSAVRAVLGWLGLGAIGLSVLTVDAQTAWPGPVTLLPVLGAAAAIAAGGAGMERRLGVGHLLGRRPLVWVGGLSYSLYLWHWPFLIAAEGIWGGGLEVRHRLLVVLASAIPAWVSYHLIEDPLRRSPDLRTAPPSLRLGAIGTALACVAGLAVVGSLRLTGTVAEATPQQAPGAAVLTAPQPTGPDWTTVESVERMRPSPLKANDDLPRIYATDCVTSQQSASYRSCVHGDRDGRRTVVLVGDSKAAQWFTPMDRIARAQGWRLLVMVKSGCSFADAPRLHDGQRNPSCDAWGRWALDAVRSARPEVVVTVTHGGDALEPGAGSTTQTQEAMVAGLVRQWRAVQRAGALVVPILDTPGRPGGRVPECVQENLDRLTRCGYPMARALPSSGAPAQAAAARLVPGVRVLDMQDAVCPDLTTCPPVIANVLVYRTGSHISDTYAATTTLLLSERLHAATGGLLGAAPPG